MSKFSIGDTVRFTSSEEELKGQEFVISHISRKGTENEEVCLEGYDEYFFSPSQFELVKKSPFKEGDRVTVNSVYWNEEQQKFSIDEVTGTVSDGYIDFDERTMDCFHVPVSKLGRFWSNEENGNDYDVVFCLPDKTEIKKAKQIWLDIIEERLKEIKEELNKAKESIEAIKKKIN